MRDLKKHNEEQIKLALGPINRYYQWLHTGNQNPTDEDLVMYFIEFGAEIFAREHPEEKQ